MGVEETLSQGHTPIERFDCELEVTVYSIRASMKRRNEGGYVLVEDHWAEVRQLRDALGAALAKELSDEMRKEKADAP